MQCTVTAFGICGWVWCHVWTCFTDIKKMPLGKLSKLQIAKGFEVLEEIEAAINQRKGNARLVELSSKFFTTIPHNFGRNRPPAIDNKEIVDQKKEMLMVRVLPNLTLMGTISLHAFSVTEWLPFYLHCKGVSRHRNCPDSEVRDREGSGWDDRDGSSSARPGLQFPPLQAQSSWQGWWHIQGTVVTPRLKSLSIHVVFFPMPTD